MFEQRLADALGDPAMDLTFKHHRVDGASEVIDHGVALDGDHAGRRIDLDLDDVAAVGKGLCRGDLVVRRIQAGLHPRRQLGGIARRFRHFEQIETEVGAGNAEFSIGEHDVLRRDLQQMRRELRALVDDRAPRLVQRRARDGESARASGQSRGRAVGVAHDDIDAVWIDPQLIRDELLV